MSDFYRPTSNATAGNPWDTAFLSERDLSSQVPINFVPHAGIFVTPACFSNGVYDDDAAQICISNLIASQLRRFIFDIYWNSDARVFSLCPVKVSNVMSVNVGYLPTISGAGSMFSTEPTSQQDLRARQLVPTNNANRDTTSGATIPTTTASAQTTSTTSASGTVLYQLGQFQCSSTINIDTVLAVFDSYYEQSANTIDARLQHLVFNLHAARSPTSANSTVPVLSGSQLPGRNENLGDHFDIINRYIYRPSQLEEERQNLNGSWYSGSEADILPLNGYFTTRRLPNGDISSPDGWPNENYIQFVHSRRVLLAYGTVDVAMSGYDTQQDSDIFPPNTLTANVTVQINATGGITDGCFYNASAFNVQQINSSWAVSSVLTNDLGLLGNVADNFTSCGIGPVLNATLLDSNADSAPRPYQDLGQQAIFSWAVNQPTNDSYYSNQPNSTNYRCAVIVSNNDYRGHWRVANCLQEYYVACREDNLPYRWRVSEGRFSYAQAENACASNARFDVPRTGLENTYLYRQILLEASQRKQPLMMESTWVNFNSLDIQTCWVTTGINGTCPYRVDEAAIRQRQILVPSIAAFIVLLLTVLTLLVKCNANRRNSKIRKRGEGGWDYEGIPS